MQDLERDKEREPLGARTGTRNFVRTTVRNNKLILLLPSSSCPLHAGTTHSSFYFPLCTTHREIKPLAEALGLPTEGIHAGATAVDL